MVSRPDQFAGCLVGQALADALGFPVEGEPPEMCERYVREVLRSGRAGETSHFGFPFGQYTDDSQLARELVQSFVACGRFDPADYAARTAALFADGRVVGRGKATERAARRLASGVPWHEAGTPSPSAGNGSAMRAGPVGLFFFDDPERMIQAAHDQGRVTHQDPRCSAGAITIAGAVSLALRGGTVDPESLAQQLAEWAASRDEHLAQGLLSLPLWVQLPPEEAVAFIGRVGLPPDFRDHWRGISPFVTTSVLWSLYAFLRSPEDYWETICTAIGVGGDVDTAAAMAGAVSGAHLGLGAIPADLARCLTDRDTWGYEELVRLAEDCLAVAVAQR